LNPYYDYEKAVDVGFLSTNKKYDYEVKKIINKEQ